MAVILLDAVYFSGIIRDGGLKARPLIVLIC